MDYIPNLTRAIDFIENRLTEKITIQDVAYEACFSVYHFHRIFQSAVGETLYDYIRRRRLTRASEDLINTSKKLIDIALDYQFESQSSFTRAFKNIFGTTPGKYRAGKKIRVIYSKKELTVFKLQHLKGGITMKPKIVTVPEFKIVGMKCVSTQENNVVPELWQKFLPRMGEIKNFSTPNISYGVCECNPDLDDFDEKTEFTYLAGIPVKNFDNIPKGMCSKTVPEQMYAVFTHKGPLSTLSNTHEYIYGTWLNNSEYDIVKADDFELYDERFTGVDDEKSEMDIYVPVKKSKK